MVNKKAPELVHFVPEAEIREQAHWQWKQQATRLRKLLPSAIIEHVGGTAIPDSITKGDLDIQVRIQPSEFANADKILAQHYQRNLLSTRNADFAAFEDSKAVPPIGIQLTAIGGDFDVFCQFRELLLACPELRASYDNLKRDFEGKEMAAYRQAKERFFALIRNSSEYKRLAEDHYKN